jgi:hypothetical protein
MSLLSIQHGEVPNAAGYCMCFVNVLGFIALACRDSDQDPRFLSAKSPSKLLPSLSKLLLEQA